MNAKKVCFENLLDGAVVEGANENLTIIAADLADLDKDAEAPRELIIKVRFKQDLDRRKVEVIYEQAPPRLAPMRRQVDVLDPIADSVTGEPALYMLSLPQTEMTAMMYPAENNVTSIKEGGE